MIVKGSEGVNDENKMGDSDKGLLDVEGKIRAKERKMAEVLRNRKEKTEKRKVKGGEGVAIDKGRKSSKEERGTGVDKDKGDGIEREDGRDDQEGKGGKVHIQRRIKRWRLGREREREREVRHIRIKEKRKENARKFWKRESRK